MKATEVTKKRIKPIVAKDADELGKVLGLDSVETEIMKAKAKMLISLREVIEKENLTHEKLAKLTGTSRTRITRLLNDKEKSLTLDFLFRILAKLGFAMEFTAKRRVAKT